MQEFGLIFSMKGLRSLFKYSGPKLKNQKPIAVDVLIKAYPLAPLSCRSNLAEQYLQWFSSQKIKFWTKNSIFTAAFGYMESLPWWRGRQGRRRPLRRERAPPARSQSGPWTSGARSSSACRQYDLLQAPISQDQEMEFLNNIVKSTRRRDYE